MSSSFCAAGKYALQNHKTKKAKLIKRAERENESKESVRESNRTAERNQFLFPIIGIYWFFHIICVE